MAEEGRDVDMGGQAGGGDSDGGDDGSSDEEVELDPADERRIMELEGKLEAGPTIYDTHVQLIELLRKCRLRERLRAARQRMHSLFPFNERQWMDWINDEMEALASPDDVRRIQALFRDAVQDYLSVAVWEAYLEFLQAADPEVVSKTPGGIKAFRHAAEEALTAAGLHLAEGHHLWQLYRAYEQGLLEAGAGGEEQVDKVRRLWHRQLQLPQLEAAQLLGEYEAWEAQHGKGEGAVPEHIRAAAKRSGEAAQLRAPHESAVGGDKPADAALLAAYMAYIQLERAQKDPARAALVYERALAAFPVTSELWVQYTRFLEAELRVPVLVNKAYARAVRNCPWVGQLWASALRALERLGGSDEQHEQMTDRALAAGMQGPEDYLAVLLARADCLRHRLAAADEAGRPAAAARLRAWFARCRDLMAQYFPDSADRSLRLPAYWAHVEGVVLGDLQAMRAVWEEAAKGPLGRHYETWLAWANMERGLRQVDAARSLFRRVHSRRLEGGGQLSLAYEWIKFEREEGSAEDLFEASLKVDPLIDQATAAAAAAANQPAAAAARAATQDAKKLTREEIRAMRRAHDPNYKERKPGTKRDLAGGSAAAAAAEAPEANGGGRDAASPPSSKRSRAGEAGAEEAAAAEAAAGPDPSGAAAAAAAGVGDVAPRRPARDEHTVFVKGLGFDVHEDDLRRLFSELGVKSVRMGKDRATGQPRGFAYVDFGDDEAVRRAADKDGEVVNGRRLFIAKSDPPGGGGGRGRGGGRDGFGGGRGPGGGRDGFGGGRGPGGGRDGFGGGRGPGGGGRDGFGGHGGGGRGRGGLGYHGGGGRGRGHDTPAAAHGNMGHQRHHLQLDEDKPGARMPALVPRALIAKHSAGGGGGGGADGAAAAVAPKTNDDFRRMLLEKKQPQPQPQQQQQQQQDPMQQ